MESPSKKQKTHVVPKLVIQVPEAQPLFPQFAGRGPLVRRDDCDGLAKILEEEKEEAGPAGGGVTRVGRK